MGFGFLAPLLLAGAALVAVPWLVHRIRQPERRAVRFSSLLFVPVVERQAVERRRVQHPLLMLLRMLMLLIAAAAFARPYREVFFAAPEPQSGRVNHVIALDVSYSMAALGHMEEAQERALAVVDELPVGDRVAVVAFARVATIGSPLSYPDETENDSVRRARRAISDAAPTWEGTDYAMALQAAERLLLDESPAEGGRIIHLISDFQEAGIPPSASGWRLSSGIALDPVVIGQEVPVNLAVEELAVRPVRAGQLQVRARVRNWSADLERSTGARLVADGREVGRMDRSILPGSASQVVFALPWDGLQPLSGYVEIGADGLPADDRRYFAVNPSRQHRVLLVRQRGVRSYDRLIEAAVPASADIPWRLAPISPGELSASLDDPPRLVVAADLEDMDESLMVKLRAYIHSGGRLFLLLGDRATAASIDRLLGADAGLHLEGRRAAADEPGSFARLAWVDLSHPVFLPFRGARFNDFSALRFSDYHRIRSAAPAAVLARFQEDSGDSAPAMIEVVSGTGRVLLWAGGIDPAWSNLSRSPRFVPLLHETLRYLTADRPPRSEYAVGDPVILPMQDQEAPPPWEADSMPLGGEAERLTLASGSFRRLEAPEFLRWRRSGQPDWQRVEAINIDATESDPARVSPAEFAIRLCDAALALGAAAPGEGAETGAVSREYGRAGVGLLLGFLLLESWYATHLARRSRKKDR